MREKKVRKSGRKKRGFLYEVRRNYVMFIMLIPAMAFFIINNYIPMVGVYYAFTRFNFAGGLFGSPFIGMDNFRFLFNSGKLVHLTMNTISYNVAFIAITNVMQIACAILLNRLTSKLFTRVSQSVIFLPYFVSYVILNVIVYNVFNYDVGYLNNVRASMGLAAYNAYSDTKLWPVLLVVLYIWKQLGYGTVVYLAAITGIPVELYEAAEIDGATIVQQLRFITIPMLFQTFVILLLFALGGIVRGQFDLFYQVIGNNGMLFDTTDILDTFVYRSLKQSYDIGMGTAAGLYQSVFGLVVVMATNWIIKRRHPEYALF